MPLCFSDTPVWFEEARVSHRRCIEGVYHCIHANMMEEATEMICDVDSVCAHLREGEGFNLLDYVIELHEKSLKASLKKETKDRVDHYYRWLLRSMSALVTRPAVQIGVTLTSEPTTSIARRDYVRRIALFQNGAFENYSFIFVQAMGGFKEFGACLMNLEGHKHYVASVCFNHDGS